MFDEFGPAHPAQPPAGAMNAAIRRGRAIRRRRVTAATSAAALSLVLTTGFVLLQPLRTDKALLVPVPPAATTAAPDYSIITTVGLSSEKTDLDAGTLTKITTHDGVLTLIVDREKLYFGDAAKAHNGGKVPPDDMYIEEGAKNLTFVLDPHASLTIVNNDLAIEKATPAQLIHKLRDGNMYIWMRHTNGPNGPVTALAQQYHP